MKILLFGGSGLLGQAIQDECKKSIFPLKCITPSHKQIDITNYLEVRKYIEKYKPDIVINCAALVGIDKCENDVYLARYLNVYGQDVLASETRRVDIPIIYMSSVAVFSSKRFGYNTEKSKPRPMNEYAITKWEGELVTRLINPKHFIYRLPLLFGPHKETIIDKLYSKAKHNEPIESAYDKVESLGYTLDIAKKIVNNIITFAGRESMYGIYHLTNVGKVSYYDLSLAIASHINSSSRITHCKYSKFNTNKSIYKPNYSPLASRYFKLRGWKEALYDYIDTYKE